MSDDYFPDPYHAADLILDERRDSFPCASCGDPTPAILHLRPEGGVECWRCHEGRNGVRIEVDARGFITRFEEVAS